MDKEEAKLILGCYRPNGKDALDPEMRQALKMAEHDPELAEWFKREQELDGILCEKICECEVPESLKTSIIAGRKLVKFDTGWSAPWVLAMAAMLAVVVGVAYLIFPTGNGSASSLVAQQGFSDFRAQMVDYIRGGVELDMYTDDREKLDMWLMENSTPLVSSDSTQHFSNKAMGCKSFNWDGKPVSLVCYRVGEGKVLHLFVMDMKEGAVADLPRQDTKLLETVSDLHTASWQEQDKAFLLVGHDPNIRVTPFL